MTTPSHPTLGPTVGGLLLSSVCDVRDRYLRLLHGVEELRRTRDLGARELLRESRDHIESLLTEFETKIVAALKAAELEDHPNKPDQWSSPYQKRWSDLTRGGFRDLTAFHRKFFRHLTGGTSPPADIGYFLARGAGLSPTRPSHRRRFALSHSQYSAFESARVSEHGLTPIIPVPYVETLTPLRWPLLLHELGHHVLPVNDDQRRAGRDVARHIVGELLPDDVRFSSQNAMQEVLADAVAERYCGPAYALALIRESQLVSMVRDQDDEVQPQIIDRLRLLDYWPSIEPALPAPWRRELSDPSEDLTDQRARALERLSSPETIRPEVVALIEKLFLAGQPAPSVRTVDAPSKDALRAAALGRTSPLSDDDLTAVFGRSADTASNDAEVLTAAWRIEACRPAAAYLEVLSNSLLGDAGSKLDFGRLEVARDGLTRRDTAISRSLQASAVHRWLVEHDSTIKANLDRSSSLPQPGLKTLSKLAAGETAPESSPLADVQLLRRLTLPAASDESLVVRPVVDPSQIGGTTVDLRLGTEWEAMRTTRFQALNPTDDLDDVTTLLDASVEQFRLTSGQNDGLVLHPGELILALTLEYLRLPDDLWGNLEGRSTWARIGLQVHASAGMVDAGFDGYLTLELQNTSRLPLVLYPGLRVAQMAFFPVPGVARAYRRKSGAAYSDQTSARTAFPRQHEHEALREYHRAERVAEEAARPD